MTEQLKLADCPFCGGKAAMSILEDEPGEILGAWVACRCGVEIHKRRTEAEAAKAWNTRAIPAPDARVREAAEYVLANFKKSEADGYRSRDRQFAIAILDKALSPQQGAVEADRCPLPHYVETANACDDRSTIGAKSQALDPATVETCAKVVDSLLENIAAPVFSGSSAASARARLKDAAADIRALAKEPDQSVTRPERDSKL